MDPGTDIALNISHFNVSQVVVSSFESVTPVYLYRFVLFMPFTRQMRNAHGSYWCHQSAPDVLSNAYIGHIATVFSTNDRSENWSYTPDCSNDRVELAISIICSK